MGDLGSADTMAGLGTETFFAGEEAPQHAHAHLWLSDAQRVAFMAGNRQSPMAAFSALMSFWAAHVISTRILNRKREVKAPRALAELRHASVALLHALLCLAAGFYLLIFRDLGAACGDRAFCFEEQTWLLMDLHLGFLLYELVFYHNHSQLLRPQFSMTLLHHIILLLAYLLSKLFPCKLSLEVLPYLELTAVADIFNALRMLLNQFGAPAHVHFNNLLAMMAAFVARVLISAIVAWKAYGWVRDLDLWSLDLPEEQSLFAIPYGVLIIAGSWVLLLIYIKWFVEATEIVNNLVTTIERQRQRAEEQAAKEKAGGDRKRR